MIGLRPHKRLDGVYNQRAEQYHLKEAVGCTQHETKGGLYLEYGRIGRFPQIKQDTHICQQNEQCHDTHHLTTIALYIIIDKGAKDKQSDTIDPHHRANLQRRESERTQGSYHVGDGHVDTHRHKHVGESQKPKLPMPEGQVNRCILCVQSL